MDKQQAKIFQDAAQKEAAAVRPLLAIFANPDNAGRHTAAFDSLQAEHVGGREAAFDDLPSSLQRILSHADIKGQPRAIFDGLSDGIAEYQRRNGGDMPSEHTLAAALTAAAMPFGGAERYDSAEPTFDSLNLGHHEANSMVPAITQVVIAYGISNSLPLISMLPNPMGSNELPIVYGTAVAGMNMGVMRRNETMDGDKAGMPYLENRHTLTMDAAVDAGEFTLTSRLAYTHKVRADTTSKFIIDGNSPLAPFLGGRVSVMVKGIEVGSDKHRTHATTEGVSVLQPTDKAIVGVNTYILASGTANLDTHKIEVKFDVVNGDEPADDDVTIELVFDYERKDDNGAQIIREPSTDMNFEHRSIYAHPSRSRSVASIDSITQLSNELGLNWYAAAQTIAMQRYYFEQTGRLLRSAINMCLSNQDPEHGRVVTFNFTKNGVTPTNIASAFSNVNITLGLARSRLSTAINMAISGYDLFVSDRGAAFFSGLDGSNYEPTGEPFGDQYSVYRIGKMKASGANVYYVPKSMGVFNEDAATTTAHALLVPRANTPAQAAFVGMVAVPPMVLTSNGNAYEKDVAIYSRQAGETNPLPRYRNQFMLIEMINLPAL